MLRKKNLKISIGLSIFIILILAIVILYKTRINTDGNFDISNTDDSQINPDSTVQETVINTDADADITNVNNSQTSSEQTYLKDCMSQIDTILVGKWENYPTDLPATFILTLQENGKFIYEAVEIEGDEYHRLEGVWAYNDINNSIKFSFTELNDPWYKILSDNDLKKDLPSVVSYSLEEKSVELQLGYMGYLPEHLEYVDFESCKEDRYYINMFNIYIYKLKKNQQRNDQFR